ncbi:MAG: terminase family protein [Rhodospirillaceae bacterium]|nr:terminase family protein [Rhodospirillaceae bacterium]
MSRLSDDFAIGLDPARIMTAAGLEPDPWQEAILSGGSNRHLLLCSRQSGKSTTCAALAVHTALYEAPALVLLVSPSLRQSQELFRKTTDFHRNLNVTPGTEQESALRIEFANGSRIIALPGTEATVRGYSAPKLIIMDEASRIEDALYTAMRPMLATTRGRLLALTTPYGCRGWFHDAWTSGDRTWSRTRITADQCPRISPDWLADERRHIGELQFRQEYMCEFVDTDEQVFSTAIIENAIKAQRSSLWPSLAA